MNRSKRISVVCGVSGVGKSTIGMALACKWEANFLDADDYHPQENIEHMSKGLPLTDEMRAGWLDSICQAIQDHEEDQFVIACSALKMKYRNAFRAHFDRCQFVLLDVSERVLQARMRARTSHFMPVSLLDSQLATLERPGAEESDVYMVDGTLPVNEIIAHLTKIGPLHS